MAPPSGLVDRVDRSFPSPFAALDRFTRVFWRVTGRPVDLVGPDAWLQAPMNQGSGVGEAWVPAAAAAYGGSVVERPGSGLLDLSRLDGPGFRAADLRPEVRDFYAHTSDWRIGVRTRWNPLFRPAGELVSRLFAHRVQQLAIPLGRAGEQAMDSRVVVIAGLDGEQLAAAWLRTLRASGDYVYSGCYAARRLPGTDRASVHVTFPLESGNVQVFLRPAVLPGGGLELRSPAGPFGQDGAYVVVEEGGSYAARVPIHETFRVYVDEGGVLRTDHELRLWGLTAVRLHYTLTRRT